MRTRSQAGEEPSEDAVRDDAASVVSATPTDDAVEATTRGVVAVVKAMVPQMEEAWTAPPPMPAMHLSESSAPVYIAVKALKHRLTMGIDVPKLVAAPVTIGDDGDVRVKVEAVDDARLVVLVEQKLDPNKHRFYFQPLFDTTGDVADRKVDATVYLLQFTPEQIQEVRDNAAEPMKTLEAEQKEPHLVLTVVPDDSDYADLSSHLEAPTAFNTHDGRPNTMVVPFDQFVAGSPTKFIAPRVSV